MNPRTDPRAKPAQLRARAETAVRAKAGTKNPPSLTAGSALAMLHELQVHQIELELQNEELRAAQLELEESRARYLDLYDLAPVGQCMMGHTGLILQANLTLATLLGVMRGALVGQSFARFIVREDQDTFHLLMNQIRAAQVTVKAPTSPCHSCELRLKQGAGGTAVWVSLVVTAARGQNGEPEMRVVVTDISPRRAREAAARLEAQTQMEILNAIPAHVALVDPEGVIQVTNESWRQFATANLLQGPEFSLGQNYLKVCERATGPCSEEAKDAAAGIRRVLRGEVDEFSIEYPCHSPTEQRWFRLIATPLRQGRGGGAVVMHVNVTERKLAELKLRNSEARARAIIEASPVAMALNDSADRITFLNPAFTAAFGYTLADIPTLADWWPKAYPDPAYRQQVAEQWRAELARAAQLGTAFAPLELSIRCKDGTERYVLVSAAPLGETFVGIHLVVLHDITGQFDLAVTDMNMPEVTGLAVARDLLEVRADLPIVLVSGNIEEELRQAARAVGIRGIVCKPFTNEEICDAIQPHAF